LIIGARTSRLVYGECVRPPPRSADIIIEDLS
jgi:hypothetical protein